MKQVTRLFGALGACLSATLLPVGAPLQAETVTNVASARWSVDGRDFNTDSNVVSFEVRAESGASLTTLTPAPGGNQTVSLSPDYCFVDGSTLRTRSVATPSSTDISLVETSQIRIGQRLVVRVDAPFANTDPGTRETLRLTLTTPGGDREQLTAVEDGENSNAFYASIGTIPFPPPIVQDDCRLSLDAGETISISAFRNGQDDPVLFGLVDALADPFGVVFDSLTGELVNGASITLIDVATGQPADVFAFDGVTPYPSTVITGTQATDANGDIYPFAPGEYRFPLVGFGDYRLEVTPPAPYTAPSDATPEELAGLRGPGGEPFEIAPGSYGNAFSVDSVIPVQLDIPVDAPGGSVTIDKRASRDIAQPGDAVFYTVTVRNRDGARPTRALTLTDQAAGTLRLQPESLRINGQEATAATFAPDSNGQGFSLDLGQLGGGETARITYAFTVRPDAPPGEALNSAKISAPDGNSAQSWARIRILRDQISGRMTIIGRIVDNGCQDPENARGIPGVRVMMEDGSFAITDIDGRYHFDGVVPGNHVVQAARETLPEGGTFVDCADSSRSAGSAFNRFVSGQGGSLKRVDFVATLPEGTDFLQETPAERGILSDQEAAGADVDWLALGDGMDGFVFPAIGHNPRSQNIRVVVRHRPGQSVDLTLDGKPADKLAFDGVQTAADKSFAVSVWRGLSLIDNSTRLVAAIRDADGGAAETFERTVNFASTPMRAELLRDKSNLVADGSTQPVLAVRITDRYGNPVHSGVSGTLTLASPYQVASALEARQQQALTGFGSASATYQIEGDDGVAYIRLAPTLVSGALRANFDFTDGDTSRSDQVETWVEPGDQPWTIVGIAEGSIGARNVAENMERAGPGFDSDLGDNARVAFYAKGRILGKYLLTVAYDSAAQEEDEGLLGQIDPAAYYTVYGDGSERLFDAASREKLYVRIESSAFYALFGDFETGFDQTILARYLRTATGVKGEVRSGRIKAEAFAAKIGSRARRGEFQGDGTTGPYVLDRGVIANSEQVFIEVRDRLRSEIIIERRQLTRFVDYDIDLLSGTIRFSQPVLSRDFALNPRFIVINYEVDQLGDAKWNAGARATYTSPDDRLRVGVTGITDEGGAALADENVRSNLGAVDARFRVTDSTEIRAEAGLTERDGETGKAFMAEVQHQTGPFDLLAYVRQVDEDYGVGQQNLAERGRRKMGIDARLQVADDWTLIASAWHDESLTEDASREAVELRAAWRTETTDAYIGVAYIGDDLADGTSGNSTVLEGGVTQRLFDNKLELSAASSIALTDTNSVDLPARHGISARYAVSNDVRLVGTYEIARGDAIDANTLKGGVEFTPWNGATVVSTLGRDTVGNEALGEDSDRTFAAFTIGQALRLDENLVLDATIDTNKTIGGGIAVSDVVNPEQPVSSGGQLSSQGTLGEDFTAFTIGGAFSKGKWNARARGEYRDGEFANRAGVTFAAIRELGNGSVAGGGFTWTEATSPNRASTEVLDAAFSLAHRPDDSDFAFLSKLEYRSDAVTGAVAGEAGPVGQSALIVTGDAKSRRVIASVAANWTPTDEDTSSQRSEVGLFAGVRHNFDRFEGFDLSGTTVIGGVDARIGLGERVEVGGRASVRHNVDSGVTSFSVGPEIGFVPADNVLVSVGYNVIGYRDPDFSAARTTDQGLFASIRLKFDADSFGFLGRGR